MLTKNAYLIGFFAGINNLGNTVIFGAAITSSAKKGDYEILLNSFITLMGRSPETIVSDQDTALIACLEDWNSTERKKIKHLFDSWHYLKSLKVKNKVL